MNNNNGNQRALLLFSINPVQDFISTARTVRDLWTGSYTLSWLTARAMSKAAQSGAELLNPADRENPLFQLMEKKERAGCFGKPEALRSGLPNAFSAFLPPGQASAIGGEIHQAVLDEWKAIASAVKTHLDKCWSAQGWDTGWQEQVDHFWEIRIAILPPVEDMEKSLKELAINPPKPREGESADDWRLRLELRLLAALAGARKTIRHYPPHEDVEETRPKCAMDGVHSQMGPRARGGADPMKASATFWEDAAPKAHERWERLQKKDRFCAIQLVKRFAWALYFSYKTGFENRPGEMRIWDTATHAAMAWMHDLQKKCEAALPLYQQVESLLMQRQERQAGCHWSGQWLYWKDDSQAEDEMEKRAYDQYAKIPIQEALQKARELGLGAPTAYFAVLAMDGDHMGRLLSQASRAGRGQISRALSDFALKEAPAIVEEEHGTLVYAGGDDVLAILPTDRVLSCARRLNDAFNRLNFPEIPGCNRPTLSAGIASAHYKTDLREVLESARAAEKKAKNDGRNRLAINVMRRSGEHSTSSIPWRVEPPDHASNDFIAPLNESNNNDSSNFIKILDELVQEFKEGATDRWLYHLRAEFIQLTDPSPGGAGLASGDAAESDLCELIEKEFYRLLKRAAEGDSHPPSEKNLNLFWPGFFDARKKRTLADCGNAIILLQTASFLARGKDE